jgi:hypothetical protein
MSKEFFYSTFLNQNHFDLVWTPMVGGWIKPGLKDIQPVHSNTAVFFQLIFILQYIHHAKHLSITCEDNYFVLSTDNRVFFS